jgi:hypothetical protein
VHLPKRALGGGRLRRLRGALGIRVDLPQREVTEGEQQPFAQLVAYAPDDGVRGRAVRALEIPVHDQLELGAIGPVDMVLG